jgi:hypothetical protein
MKAIHSFHNLLFEDKKFSFVFKISKSNLLKYQFLAENKRVEKCWLQNACEATFLTKTKSGKNEVRAVTCKHANKFILCSEGTMYTRVTRFFLEQNTKTGKNIPNYHEVYQMSIKYNILFHCKTLQNLPKFFLVWKQTIWQPWWKRTSKHWVVLWYVEWNENFHSFFSFFLHIFYHDSFPLRLGDFERDY